ncbi:MULTISPECIES: protein-glutamate O-methyltransferase CheR [Kluyvera]|jgi:chemotaxis protein methyltransferase CheR|uniref:Chemotaxis protein methyltransferase n=1 Tax=Kluyvera ascorbata TaxID=51288 RepID=A0A378GPM2_9ENTR|nr:protein-glutamate O-methyltransferase CheR [Kluyvera ascorbata]BBV65484.1 chemotaxis protein methyltransferase [Klebsiella sp. STW0522-44]HEB4872852.1 protein-glutamate O-methyltransferase CheR [Kluyvera ascorbata F0526]EJG2384740.1 protein-glutamate O-methyltransferase CheR [Kluyvera ascorbata]KFD00579.1 chemotaxis protein methyltransferase [Kluyvera ascorbata ATCC 33433]MDT8702877.1 protein-glutamate O-methyltransferase CheR [Kluyvera ascorbata]
MTVSLPNGQSQLLSQLTQRLTLTDGQFRRICQLIYQRAGIVLADHKRDMVYNRLVRRLRTLNLDDFGHYLSLLEANGDSPEWQAFINSLTTNLTAFFREAHHFPTLAEHAARRQGEYRVWSAAASTGEEPYSIAITLADTLGTAPGRWKVFASDIDTEVLEKAQSGIYRMDELKTLSQQQLQRYFMRGTGPHSGLVRVRSELANYVDFSTLNLLNAHYNIPGPFDAIFCRNVMIYFDKTTQQEILKRFVPLLKPDGLLFAGHSENFSHLAREFSLRGQTVYALSKGRT